MANEIEPGAQSVIGTVRDDVRKPLPADKLSEPFNQILREKLPAIAQGLAVLYVIFAIAHYLLLPKPILVPMLAVALLTALALATLPWFVQLFNVRDEWAHLVMVGIGFLVLINSALHMYLTKDPSQTTNFMLLAIAAGAVLLDWRYLAGMLGSTAAVWICMAFVHRGSQGWIHFGFAILTASVASILIFQVRKRSMTRLHMMAKEQAAAARTAMESEVRFRQLAEANFEGIVIHEGGLITDVNQRTCVMLGYARVELVGRAFNEFVAAQDGNAITENFYGFSDRDFRLTGRRKDGSFFPMELKTKELLNSDKRMRVIAIRDISERHELDRIKDEFVSVVSHELRTPLTSIRGALGLLSAEQFSREPDKAKRVLELARNNVERLMQLINDILDLQQIDSGQATLARQPCFARDLIEQSVALMTMQAEQRQVILRSHIEDFAIYADFNRLIQTMTNLISNAIKFSCAGGRVEVSCAPNLEERHVLFCIRDFGRGIPLEKLEIIFERFQQVDGSDSRDKGGTGLGLSICRSIVEHHGGQIWVESEMGKGSSFKFILPMLDFAP